MARPHTLDMVSEGSSPSLRAMKYIVKYHGVNSGKGIHVTESEAEVIDDVTVRLKSTMPGRELTISIANEDNTVD